MGEDKAPGKLDWFWGPFFLSMAALGFCTSLGIPLWTTWTPGDATDIAVAVFLGSHWMRKATDHAR